MSPQSFSCISLDSHLILCRTLNRLQRICTEDLEEDFCTTLETVHEADVGGAYLNTSCHLDQRRLSQTSECSASTIYSDTLK